MTESKMTTFYCEYQILPEHTTRDACMTFFGGMTHEDDLKELGDVKLLGRWSCVGEARGFCIAQAANVVDMQKWLNNWVSMADIKVVPVLDDNQHRELLLGHSPDYMVSYDRVNNKALEGESLYFVKYQFRDGCRDSGFKAFANMTEEQDKQDSGACTSYGRWHVPSQGCGYAIASCPSSFDMYKWAHNWNSLCDCFICPVTGDAETRSIIKQGFGFAVKYSKLMEQMKELMVHSGPCFVNAKFTFKDHENKQKFLKLLASDDGLAVTRKFPGCESVECFESCENDLVFNIKQKWRNGVDHANYMKMRKESGLFDSVMEMVSEPFEVTHLNRLDY